MKIIKKLSKSIEEELEDACKYAEWALSIREERPELARRLYNISVQEMEHMKTLHDSVVEIINEYRKEHGEPPQGMQEAYNYLHEMHIAKAGEVKALQQMFKEG